MDASRRRFLLTASMAGVIGIAGCSGNGDDVPDPDANPRDLLPETPDGWTVETEANEQLASLIGAEAGYSRSFYDPADDYYSVEFYRFPSNADAEQTASTYEGWTAYVVRGNFGFAANGADVESVYLMLGNSPALTAEYARDTNQL